LVLLQVANRRCDCLAVNGVYGSVLNSRSKSKMVDSNSTRMQVLDLLDNKVLVIPKGEQKDPPPWKLLEDILGAVRSLWLQQSQRGVFTTMDITITRPGAWNSTSGSGTLDDWLGLVLVTIVLVTIDNTIFVRMKFTFVRRVATLIFMLAAAALYGAYLGLRHGPEASLLWYHGYGLEWALSIDNLFVFHLLMTFYQASPELQEKAMSYWVGPAAVFRVCLLLVVGLLGHAQAWCQVLLGVILAARGVFILCLDDDENADPSEFMVVRFAKWILGDRLDKRYDEEGGRLFTTKGETVQVTLLALVVLLLVISDIAVSFDSAAAKVAQIPHAFLNCSSTVLALFGMRAASSFLACLTDYKSLLQYLVGALLIWTGVSLIRSTFVEPS